jgi:hypothetical protein
MAIGASAFNTDHSNYVLHTAESLRQIAPLSRHVKHCLDFSFVFSAPLPAWRNLFLTSDIFCGGKY